MTDEHPDRLDLILNAAIRDYSNAEPRAGLEGADSTAGSNEAHQAFCVGVRVGIGYDGNRPDRADRNAGTARGTASWSRFCRPLFRKPLRL